MYKKTIFVLWLIVVILLASFIIVVNHTSWGKSLITTHPTQDDEQ